MGTTAIKIADIDRAQTLATQLHALLVHSYGTGGEAFRGLSDELMDSYLWACADMADQLRQVLETPTSSGDT